MEERRLLLAVALSFAVLMGYRVLFPPPPPGPGDEAPRSPEVTLAAAAPTPEPAAAAGASEEPGPTGENEAPEGLAPVADTEERRVEVEGSDYEIAFTNRGAAVVSWRLPGFRDERGRPEELIQVSPHLRPMELRTGDAVLDARLREALFLPSEESVSVGTRPRELRFEYVDGGLEVVKEFAFAPDEALIGVRASVRLDGREVPSRLAWGPGVGGPAEQAGGFGGYYGEPQAVYAQGASIERLAVDDLEAPTEVAVDWAGVESTYFVALLIPAGRAPATLGSALGPGAEGEAEEARPTAAVPASAGVEVYVGPKDYHALAELGRGLERVVPVGDWIGPIVVPLLSLLRWVHGIVGNYGWAIVGLTIVINLLMAPLRHYSIANSIKMARIAPEMRVIQERYRKVPALDPRRQEMQKEVSALYARHGMSMGTQMAVGCLPILITMPFLFAFYRVLTVSIDLRGAPYLWIADLSQKDPLYITPVLMGVTMLLMQRMMPTTMDPAQQRVMLIMPLVLVVMFFAAPAGLNLYWLSSNVCSIVQQGLTLRLLKGRQEPEAAGSREKRKGKRR